MMEVSARTVGIGVDTVVVWGVPQAAASRESESRVSKVIFFMASFLLKSFCVGLGIQGNIRFKFDWVAGKTKTNTTPSHGSRFFAESHLPIPMIAHEN
jgi:hypothetical protein